MDKTLADFLQYCRLNPHQRFWQALRNWAEVDFLLVSNFAPHDFGKAGGTLEDTFSWKGRNAKE